MASAATSDEQQSPAVSPKLKAGVETSIAGLQAWARANGQNWDALTDPDALLLQSLLTKSKGDMKRGIAPIYPRGEFNRLSGEGLTGRRWEKFLRWYGREIEAELAKVCTERAEPMIYPGRASARAGGHPDKAQAIYFLSFDRPVQLVKRSEPENSPTEAAGKAVSPPASEPPHAATEAAGKAVSPPASEPPHAPASADGARPNAGKTVAPSDRLPNPQNLPSPAGVFLSIPSADHSSSSIGWLAAIALAFVIATATAPTGDPLADEFLRLLSAARDVLSGAIIVRF